MALKKRRLKGLTGMKKEQLMERLKKEIRSQQTLGGGARKGRQKFNMREGGGVGDVQEEDAHQGGSEDDV